MSRPDYRLARLVRAYRELPSTVPQVSSTPRQLDPSVGHLYLFLRSLDPDQTTGFGENVPRSSLRDFVKIADAQGFGWLLSDRECSDSPKKDGKGRVVVFGHPDSLFVTLEVSSAGAIVSAKLGGLVLHANTTALYSSSRGIAYLPYGDESLTVAYARADVATGMPLLLRQLRDACNRGEVELLNRFHGLNSNGSAIRFRIADEILLTTEELASRRRGTREAAEALERRARMLAPRWRDILDIDASRLPPDAALEGDRDLYGEPEPEFVHGIDVRD